MNDDNYWVDVLRNYMGSKQHNYSWAENLSSQAIYDLLLNDYSRKDTDMSWNYSYGRHYHDTRGDEVATAVLEAYSNGVAFETLIRKNSTVRQYWYQIQSEKAAKEKAKERELERQRKLAEKRAIEQAKREEVLAKLTPEELEVFGLKKGKKK